MNAVTKTIHAHNDIIKNIDHYEIERLVSFSRKPIEALEVIGKEIVNDKIRIEIFKDLQNFDNEKKLEGAKILLMFTDFLDDRQINFIKKCIEKSTLSETNKEEIYNLIEKYKTSWLFEKTSLNDYSKFSSTSS